MLQERLPKRLGDAYREPEPFKQIGFLGPASETLSALQLELLTEEKRGATREEVEAESQREPILTQDRRDD